LFTHEKVLDEELAKIRVQLSLAEKAEKDKTPKDGDNVEAKPDESKDEKEPPQDKSSAEKSKEPLVNGVDTKQKLENGDSIDSDSTAVNTPGSSTPLTGPSTSSPPSTTEKETDDADEIVPTVESLRQQALHLQKLMDFLREEFEPTRQKLKDLLDSNDIKFGLLWCLFRLGATITFKDNESGLNMAGEVPQNPPYKHFGGTINWLDYECRVYASRRPTRIL
jgi:hypothetical protein